MLAVCLFWVIPGRIARGGYFYGAERHSWHSKGKDRRGGLGLHWWLALHPCWARRVREREREMILAATTALWGHPFCFPTGGRELAESVGFVLAQNSALDNLPWILGDSLGVLSATAARQKFFMVSLSCLASSTFIYFCTKGYSYSPLTGIQNCTRLKPAHWLNWHLSKSNLFGFFSLPLELCHLS